jgi:4-amino-4-deoxy-L-arabinose transferase-like glycosyltransferase
LFNEEKTVENHWRHYLLLMIILAATALVRINTFWLPHDTDDEVINIALALKMEDQGLSDQSFKNINRDMFSLDGKTSLIELMLLPGDDKGNLLRSFESRGITGFDSSRYSHPPAFPFLIMLSQKTIGSGNGYFYSNTPYSNELMKKKPPAIFFGQLYAVIIPFVFSLLFVFLVYLTARRFFDASTGLIAAALMAFNPVDLLVSFRLWGDIVSICFLLVALIFVQSGFKDRSWFKGLLAGVSIGLAMLFHHTAILLIVGVWLYHLWFHRRTIFSLKGLRVLLFDPFIMALTAGFLIAGAWWLIGMYRHTGTLTPLLHIDATLTGALQKFRENRTPTLILYTIGFIYLTPLAIFALGVAFKSVRTKLQDKAKSSLAIFIFIIAAFIILLAFVFESKEHRHALLAYVAIVILAARVINLIRSWAAPLTAKWRWLNANELVAVALILAARWSTLLLLDAIERGALLISVPF